MGVVIPLFKDGRSPVTEEPREFELDDLSDPLLESIGEVISDLETIFTATTDAEFLATMRAVKARVSGWPDG
jgi:hypothetical protein